MKHFTGPRCRRRFGNGGGRRVLQWGYDKSAESAVSRTRLGRQPPHVEQGSWKPACSNACRGAHLKHFTDQDVGDGLETGGGFTMGIRQSARPLERASAQLGAGYLEPARSQVGHLRDQDVGDGLNGWALYMGITAESPFRTRLGANLRTLSRDLGNLRVPNACRGAHLKHFTGPRCRRRFETAGSARFTMGIRQVGRIGRLQNASRAPTSAR